MNLQTQLDSALIVRSFAHVARQLARSAQFTSILAEAEKHQSALRLLERDVFDATEQAWREHTLTKEQFHRLREAATQILERGQRSISRIAAQYAPHRLAA